MNRFLSFFISLTITVKCQLRNNYFFFFFFFNALNGSLFSAQPSLGTMVHIDVIRVTSSDYIIFSRRLSLIEISRTLPFSSISMISLLQIRATSIFRVHRVFDLKILRNTFSLTQVAGNVDVVDDDAADAVAVDF